MQLLAGKVDAATPGLHPYCCHRVAAATVAVGIRVTVDTATPGLHLCCLTWAASLLLLLLLLMLLLLQLLLLQQCLHVAVDTATSGQRTCFSRVRSLGHG